MQPLFILFFLRLFRNLRKIACHTIFLFSENKFKSQIEKLVQKIFQRLW